MGQLAIADSVHPIIEVDMESLGTLLTHRTIRLALACMVGTFAIRIANKEHWGRDTKFSKALWTLGCGFFVAHVLFAFNYFHHWSHAHALKVTADRTREQLGVAFGEGIFFSYFFTLLWVAEVVVMWAWPKWYDNRPRWLYWTVSAFMAFIAFNGAVVFEDGITRPLGFAATLGLVSLGYFAQREQERLKALSPGNDAESSVATLPAGSGGVEGEGPEPASEDSAPALAENTAENTTEVESTTEKAAGSNSSATNSG